MLGRPHLAEMFSHPALTPGTPLRLELVDQLNNVEEPAALAVADQCPCQRNCQMISYGLPSCFEGPREAFWLCVSPQSRP